MRVAYFGGSFDPPHLAHVAVARAALEALKLDKVLFAPVGRQPLKPDGASASFADRVAMTRLAISGQQGFELSLADAPGDANEANYTAETLEKLKAELPAETRLFMLMGADSLATLPRWHRAEELPFLADFIVATRPGQLLEDPARYMPVGVEIHPVDADTYALSNAKGQSARLYLLHGLELDDNATELRDRLSSGDEAEDMRLAPGVLAYIRERHLYQ